MGDKCRADQNFFGILKYVSSEYFMWLGGHDLLSDDYIKNVNGMIERYPDIDCMASKVKLFNDDVLTSELYIGFSHAGYMSSNPKDRLEAVWNNIACCWLWYQVFKTKTLKVIVENLMRLKNLSSSDHILAVHIALLSKIKLIDGNVYYARDNGRTVETIEDRLARYEEDFQISINRLYPFQHVPIAIWDLITTYMPEERENGLLKRRVEDIYGTLCSTNDFFKESFMSLPKEKLSQLVDENKINKYFFINKKKCVIFGAGECGSRCFFLLRNYVDIIMFIDNDRKKMNQEYWGVTVKDKAAISDTLEDIIVIIGIMSDVASVYGDLKEMGYVYEKNMFFYDDFLLDRNPIIYLS